MSIDILLLLLRFMAAITLLLFVGIISYWLWRDSLRPTRPLLLQLDAGKPLRYWSLGAVSTIEVSDIQLELRFENDQWWLVKVKPHQEVTVNGRAQQLPIGLTTQIDLGIGELHFQFQS